MTDPRAADKLIIALPSKGRLGEAADQFLGRTGLQIFKPNRRQYSAIIPSLPLAEVVYQRPRDIVSKVGEGLADIGVTGLDNVLEYGEDSADIMVIDRLGFGKCELLLAAPDSWIDVASIADLADLSLRNQERGKPLRIATKYRNLVKSFMYRQGISHFLLVHAEGAMEAAPRMGYADMIADLSETGTTLRENHLRPIDGGSIIASEAVLIGNRRAMRQSRAKLETLREMLELIEAQRRAGQIRLPSRQYPRRIGVGRAGAHPCRPGPMRRQKVPASWQSPARPAAKTAGSRRRSWRRRTSSTKRCSICARWAGRISS